MRKEFKNCRSNPAVFFSPAGMKPQKRRWTLKEKPKPLSAESLSMLFQKKAAASSAENSQISGHHLPGLPYSASAKRRCQNPMISQAPAFQLSIKY
jgi:hypothetical protein